MDILISLVAQLKKLDETRGFRFIELLVNRMT